MSPGIDTRSRRMRRSRAWLAEGIAAYAEAWGGCPGGARGESPFWLLEGGAEETHAALVSGHPYPRASGRRAANSHRAGMASRRAPGPGERVSRRAVPRGAAAPPVGREP